jgi:heme ABC exporter ATP-binding subunit CcmA
MIQVENLSKRFNNFTALDKVSLQIKKGESFALLGPNGAGKTTLVRILSTLLKPTSGNAILNGIDVTENPEEAKRQIGVVSHNPFLYNELTAKENLEFYSGLFECEPDLMDLLRIVNLDRRARDPVANFSRGMKQRLSIARAILHDPDILILDEPTSGLDLTSRKSFYKLIESLKSEGKTILLTTHYIEEAAGLCERGVVLNKGKVASSVDLKAPKSELEKMFSGLEE